MKGLEELGTVINRVRASHELDAALNLLEDSKVLGSKSVDYLKQELGIMGVVKRDGTPSEAPITARLTDSGVSLMVPRGNRMLFNSPLTETTAGDVWGLNHGTASRIGISEHNRVGNPRLTFNAYDSDSVFGTSGRTAAKSVEFVRDIPTDQTRDAYQAGTRLITNDFGPKPMPLTNAKPYLGLGEPSSRLAEFPAPIRVSQIDGISGTTTEVVRFNRATQSRPGFDPEVSILKIGGKISRMKLDHDLL